MNPIDFKRYKIEVPQTLLCPFCIIYFVTNNYEFNEITIKAFQDAGTISSSLACMFFKVAINMHLF